MSHPAIPLPPALPPADEGAFEQAVGMLESRLSAWIDAVRDVHALLQSGAATAANDTRERSAAPPETANAPVAAPEPGHGATATAKPADKPATSDAKRSERDATGDPARTPAAAKGPAKSKGIVPAAPAEPATTVSAAESAASDDEAALMAGLDPQVAAQVRMLRRLGGNTRPLRELIQEVTAAETAPKEQKKSWWR